MEYTLRMFSLSSIQFKVEKSDSSDFKSMQRRTEIVNFKLRTKFHTAKTILEDLTGEINAANIK